MSFAPDEWDRRKEEVVQIIYGEENVVSAGFYCASSTKETIDFYCEGISVYSMFHYPEALKMYKDLLSRAVRIRVITEITKDNLPSVKKGLQYISDVRHMDTITHQFAVSEKHYLANKLQFGDPRVTQSIFSNIGWFVREHQYLFESLWNKAIPLKQRIGEIEEGHKRQFMDTIRDPIEVVKLLPNVISSAYEEIILLFPTSNTLRDFESVGLTESINNQIQKNSNFKVKLLLKRGRGGEREREEVDYPHEHQRRYSSQVKNSSNKIIGQDNVEVKFVDPDQIDAKTALIIIDGERMVAIELDEKNNNDDSSPTQPNLADSIRFAIHTNSESAIMSHSSIFERLWIESEMKQQRR